MAEEKVELRDINFRQVLPWTELFRGFQVALDPKKLLLAALGLLVMAAGWWLLALIFFNSRDKPEFGNTYYGSEESKWSTFKEDRRKWWILQEAAGKEQVWTDANDLAETPAQYRTLHDALPTGASQAVVDGKTFTVTQRPFGLMRKWPFEEDRGPNPYLLVTGREGNPEEGTVPYGPWQKGQFVNWFLTEQSVVLIEPLVKFLTPVRFLLRTKAGFWNYLYFALVLIWTLATWALFGGAITRMAAVQVARKEKIGMTEAVRFTLARYLSFLSAPLFPLLFVLILLVLLMVYGLVGWIPGVGDLVIYGLGWPLALLAGLVMAVILVGLVGWPMMYATISTEGSDSFDALSRSYSYVYQSPWHYLWYCLVAIFYGALVVFFVSFMGSLMVYLAKWGVSQTPFAKDPSYLFVHAPESYHWRDLLLQGALSPDGQNVVDNGVINTGAYEKYKGSLSTVNDIGAWMVTVWLGLVFLMVVGFGYSYFWSAGTIIYLLMRRKVDDTEMDEVYLEEDEAEDSYPPAAPAAPAAVPATGTPSYTMVEPPSLKTPTPAAPAPPPSTIESPPPERGDGNPPA